MGIDFFFNSSTHKPPILKRHFDAFTACTIDKLADFDLKSQIMKP